ncbi:MAG: radical protein [Rhodoferax sp.]|nr:radical protein [Rhodoferax sp.]
MDETTIPLHALKGRGAASRLAHRFERDRRGAFDDGWGTLESTADDASPPATQVTFENAKSAITQNASPDVPFDHGLNPYRGCEHGCIYCYARPTHSYLNLSPGLDFETKLIAKRNLAEVLTRELLAPAYRPRMLAIGTVTDAYQPVERDLGITREVLQVLLTARHPLSIVTKGSGVERDIDLLAPLAEQGLAAVYVTVTTLDGELARKLEPRAAAPHRRLRTIRQLAEAGIPVGVSVAPQIPFVNEDMEQVLAAARDAGATSAFYTVLRLPWEVSPLFRQWLELHYPDRASRIMARVHDLHGLSNAQRATGKDYDANFATRMKGGGLWADLIGQRFNKACARLGLNLDRRQMRVELFNPSALRGQGSLF